MNSVDKYEKADEQKESKNMTDEQKIFELSLIWKEAEYNFCLLYTSRRSVKLQS